ncbi:MAG: DNA repair exonuclease [Desulfobulbaceae bacterium]|nr:DNA repair exonuclease [Desulfobulbaceae bacterium]
MFRFLHAADLHLDSPLLGLEGYEDAPLDEIRGATRRAFENLINLAIEEDVKFVLLSGDLFDGNWKDFNAGLFFINRISRLSRKGIKVFMVSGNHDAASRITRELRLPENVRMLSAKSVESLFLDDLGVAIHGRSYQTRAVTENLAEKYPRHDPHYFNIGLLHTALTGREGHEPYAPCSVDDLLAKGYDYWALGHIHKREVVNRDPWIVFPGNIQGRHIRETGAKGATLVTVDNGQVLDVEHRDLDVLRWSLCRVDLAGCETLDQVSVRVGQALEAEQGLASGKTLAVRLELRGECPVHSRLFEESERLTEEFREIAAGLGSMWLEKILFKTTRKVCFAKALGKESPLVALLRGVEHCEFDADGLLELAPEISSLKSKLPAVLAGADFSLLPEGEEEVGILRNQVRELLLARLIRHGENS